MRLEAIEESSLTALMNLTRPTGQLFLPVAATALLQRYDFQNAPSSDQLLGDVLHFGHGVFEGKAFDLSIYPDGAVVKSRSNTDFLEQVFGDLLDWARAELGLVPAPAERQQQFFDSELVVSLDISPTHILATQIAGTLSAYQKSYGLTDYKFEVAGFTMAVDQTAHFGRKPNAFTLARRINVPFNAHLYFSTAPLKTADHLSLLQAIETSLSGRGD